MGDILGVNKSDLINMIKKPSNIKPNLKKHVLKSTMSILSGSKTDFFKRASTIDYKGI